MRNRIVVMIAQLVFALALPTVCFANFPTPFIDVDSRKGDISVHIGYVVELAPDSPEDAAQLGNKSRFLVIVKSDKGHYLMLEAVGEKKAIDETLLGRRIQVKAIVTESRDPAFQTMPKLEILQVKPIPLGK